MNRAPTLLLIVFAHVFVAAAQETKPTAGSQDRDAVKREILDRLEQAQGLQPNAADREATFRRVAAVLTERGGRFLIASQQADGGWESETGPGITCLALKALIREPTVGPHHPAVRRGLEFVRKSVREDGGIYSAEGLQKNYESSVALSMFAALEEGPVATSQAAATGPSAGAYAKEIGALQKFLKDNQWDEGEGKSIDDPWYGGAGYGNGKRPDLSNTQMMLDALHDSGLPKDDPTYRKALVFIQRCQMLGESNDQPFARGSAQGGFIYSPANGGESKAETFDVNGRSELRAYGSMTYAGFKSMLYAGLTRSDPRVKAALDWICRHWTLDYNPNMPEKRSREGLFYYFHVFARGLDAFGEATLHDQTGQTHAWRHELVEKLAQLQRADGSWTNEADRWMEGRAPLATAYSLLALQAAYPPQPVRP